MNKLHPGSLWLFRIRGIIGSFFLLWIAGWFFTFIIGNYLKRFMDLNELKIVGITSVIIYVILFIIISEIYARMAYNRWLYEFTESNLKIERGIIWKRYSNIPYERVQNIDITRGIWARLLGFSSVNIQTAGYSYSSNNKGWSEGYLPAVDMKEAEKIREFVIKKIGRKQGL